MTCFPAHRAGAGGKPPDMGIRIKLFQTLENPVELAFHGLQIHSIGSKMNSRDYLKVIEETS
jgi:hypothetical protein